MMSSIGGATGVKKKVVSSTSGTGSKSGTGSTLG